MNHSTWTLQQYRDTVLKILQAVIENLTHLPCYSSEILIESPGCINCTVENVLKMIAKILLLNSRLFIKVTNTLKTYCITRRGVGTHPYNIPRSS